MSVQAGIWNFDGRPIDRKVLDDFSESMRHQGPDGESCFVNGSVALLYRPFHTTSDSRREKQPYVSRRGFVLTWDGRVDNRDQLIADLKSDLDAEPTDVAIVAAAFDRWESDCFRRIIGDWAISIWKPRALELLFAIDYMAVRHIFYYLKPDGVWWSTDLGPLVLLSGDTFHIDDDYIAGYFAHDPDAHLTPYREIREAPPGQFVRIRDGRVVVERYWRFNPKSRIRYKTDTEYEEHFRHVFRQSVRRRLRSDSPILAELSGGLDSSSIVCMADDILAKEGAQTPIVGTLSYFDNTEPNGDDWIYFPKVEEKRGRVGIHIDASKLGSSPASLECLEFCPLPGTIGIARKLVAQRADAVLGGGYKAVLSGLGGDEFMGGIPDPRAHLADLILQLRFISLAKQLTAWSLIKRKPWVQLLVQSAMVFLPKFIAKHVGTEAKVEHWIEKQFATRTGLATRLLGPNEPFRLCLPTRRCYAAGLVMMSNKLAKSMASTSALEEARYPYLDQSLVEFILSIPSNQILRPGDRRSLMRRSLAGIVPDQILSRKTKQFGARTPVVAVDARLDQLEEIFESPLSASLGYVNHTRFLRELHCARNGKQIHISRMMRTISLEFWLRGLASRCLLEGITVVAHSQAPMVSAEIGA